MLDRLELADAVAELAPLERVLARGVVGRLGDAERLRGDADAAAVERRHRDAEAAALLVQEPVAARRATPSTTMSFVTEELRPSFSSVRVTRIWSPSSTNAETPRAVVRLRVGAREQEHRAGVARAFVIHCLAAVIVQPSPSGSARERSEPASEPASGSVRAKAPRCSPRASGGTQRDALLVGAEA